jgi:mannose-6-phosphate isomerase-like protein (cupin superfamily)
VAGGADASRGALAAPRPASYSPWMPTPFDSGRAEADLLAVGRGEASPTAAELADRDGIGLLPILERAFCRDLPFETLERLESVLKHIVRSVCAAPASGAAARELAAFQQRIGLLFKYKSYTVKAANPLGYSIFLQNPGQGFSFQRHVTHKVELFHVLHVHPGGYVFLCDYADWLRVYRPQPFARWFAGEPDPAIERFRFHPQAGDVVTIDRLNVVHTVIGCTIEEFATTSTDMVDRLHDQNPRDQIPAHFTRQYAQSRLRLLPPPGRAGRRVALTPSGFETRPLQVSPIEGGARLVLEDRFLTAARWFVDAGAATALEETGGDAVALYIFSGTGSLTILGPGETPASARPIPVGPGDPFVVPAGVRYRLEAAGERLALSLHRGRYETLLAA